VVVVSAVGLAADSTAALEVAAAQSADTKELVSAEALLEHTAGHMTGTECRHGGAEVEGEVER
jgi:hypothetical protein